MRNISIFLFLLCLTASVHAAISSNAAQVIANKYIVPGQGEYAEIYPVVPITISNAKYWVATITTPDNQITGFIVIKYSNGSVVEDKTVLTKAIKTAYLIRGVSKIKDNKAWFLNSSYVQSLQSLNYILSQKKADIANVKVYVSDKVVKAKVDDSLDALNTLTSTISLLIERINSATSEQESLINEPKYSNVNAFRLDCDPAFALSTDLQSASQTYLTRMHDLYLELVNYGSEKNVDKQAVQTAINFIKEPGYTQTDMDGIVNTLTQSKKSLDSIYKTFDDKYIADIVSSIISRINRVKVDEYINKTPLSVHGNDFASLYDAVTYITKNPNIWADSKDVSTLSKQWTGLNKLISDQKYNLALIQAQDVNKLTTKILSAGYVQVKPPNQNSTSYPSLLYTVIVILIILAILGLIIKNKGAIMDIFSGGSQEGDYYENPPY